MDRHGPTGDLDLHCRVEAAGDGMRTVGVDDAPAPWLRVVAGDVVQPLVQLAQRGRGEVDNLDSGSGDCHQTSAFSQA